MSFDDITSRPIDWNRTTEKYLFVAVVDGEEFFLRLNDFPEEPLCTVIGQGRELHLEDFGEHWRMPWHRETE